MNEDTDMCVVCGFPSNACTLIRLTWEGDYDHDSEPYIVVASEPKTNDVLVCSACIVQIKRLPGVTP